MNHRTPIALSTIMLIVLSLGASLQSRAESEPRVDAEPMSKTDSSTETTPVQVILITLDTLRADRLGVYGHDAPTSPFIDALAKEAAVFADVTCSMPTTLPSHLSIFTGMTPTQHGITQNGMVPTRDQTSIFELLEERGARTAAVVSAGVLAEKFLTHMGIDDFFYGSGTIPATHQIPGDTVTDQGIRWLSEHADEPFALWLHYFDPHEPYTPPPKLAERFSEGYEGPLDNALTAKWLRSLNAKKGPQLTERDHQHVLDLYDAEIAFLDAQLGRLFAFLKERQLWDKTLIVLTADHGQAHGEKGFWGHGWKLFEPVIKVPLLIKLPQQETASRIHHPVETLDIFSTLTAYYGLEPMRQGNGRSLLPALAGKPLEPAPPRLIELRTGSLTAPGRIGAALHAGTWKLTASNRGQESTYSLGRLGAGSGLDGETPHPPDSEEARLLERILAAQEETTETAPELAPETLEMLRSLGYVGD